MYGKCTYSRHESESESSRSNDVFFTVFMSLPIAMPAEVR